MSGTRPSFDPAPVVLKGRRVRLEPLAAAHEAALWQVLEDGADVTRWFPRPLRTRPALAAFVAEALAGQAAGTAVPFATIDQATGAVIGSTRFGAIDRGHRRAEIGWTFLGSRWQRTGRNTEAKLLMLTHAFETWRLIRVELKTDRLNEASRGAILRLGAVEERTLRQHMVCDGGRIRDTVYFSILEAEWPAVKARLVRDLERQEGLS